MSRKTFDVEKYKQEINTILANYNSQVCPPEFLQGLRFGLETVLRDTDNYRGYQFLDVSEVPDKELPGCHFEFVSSPDRYTRDGDDLAFFQTDVNRVKYY